MQPGEIVAGKYRIERSLGSGGFGDVWVAADVTVGRHVALKTLRSFSDTVALRFSREAQALGRLQHPHCVQLFDHGELPDGTRFIVMNLVDGQTFDRWLDTRPTIDDRLRVARQITDALRAAHAVGIAHRDLKPANIIVTQTPDGPHAVVLDFGISKLAGAPALDITKTGEVLGTPGYMSPEQLRGTREAGPPADLYALGVLLFLMFEERPPFTGENAIQIAMEQLSGEAPVVTRPDVPPSLRTLIPALLARAPEDRPPSAVFVMQQLEPRTTAAAPMQPVAEAGRPGRGLGVAIVLVALVAIAAVVAVSLLPGPPEAPPPKVRVLEKPDEPEPERPVEVPKPAIARAPDAGATGSCPREMPNLDELGLDLQLPLSYPRDPHPLLVIVHDYAQGPEQILSSDRLLQLADERDMVVFAPRDSPTKDTWKDGGDRRRILEGIATALENLCIDPKRIFIIGLGNGADAGYHILCEYEHFAAAVMSGYRFDTDDPDCPGPLRPPFLFINSTEDSASPAEGGTACLWSDEVISLQEHESRLRKQWGCEGRTPREYHGCQETLVCAHPLETCRAPGGRFWDEFPMRPDLVIGQIGCRMRPARNDYLGQAFAFIDRHDPGRTSDPEDSPDDVEGVGHPAAP